MAIYDAIVSNAQLTEAQVQNKLLDAQLKQEQLNAIEMAKATQQLEALSKHGDQLTDEQKKQYVQKVAAQGLDTSAIGAYDREATKGEKIKAGSIAFLDSMLFDFIPDKWYTSDKTKGAEAIGKGSALAASILMSFINPLGISKLATGMGSGGLKVLAKGLPALEKAKTASTAAKATKDVAEVAKGINWLTTIAQGADMNVVQALYNLAATGYRGGRVYTKTLESTKPVTERKHSPYYVDPSWKDIQMLQGMKR